MSAMHKVENVHIRGLVPLVSPAELKLAVPVSERAVKTVLAGREAVKSILSGEDDRLMAVVGPCSIHDIDAALEYALRLAEVAERIGDRVFVAMRAYFEKPRTVVGWKGLINDPHLDGTFDMATGLERARRFLLRLAEMGLPAATEMLDPITPQYIADLVTWASIGARTTESQTHRQMASGLSMPIGYKNGTDGDLGVAINAMAAAAQPHSFLGIDLSGRTCMVQTTGNPWGCVIVRGGRSGPNYDKASLRAAVKRLEEAHLPSRLVIDCSHANSAKDFRRQAAVWRDAIAQRVEGERHLIGLMLESYLEEGQQALGSDPRQLSRGVSITDACLGWDETATLLLEAHEALAGQTRGPVAEPRRT